MKPNSYKKLLLLSMLLSFSNLLTGWGLASATYNVTVTDIRGCFALGSVFVDQPSVKTSGDGPDTELDPDPGSTDIKEHTAGLEASFYPNPSTGLINLKLNNKGAPRDGIVQLYDLYGKLLFVKEIRFSAGNSTCVVNLPGSISYGVYFLNIFAGEDKVLGQKLIIATHSE